MVHRLHLLAVFTLCLLAACTCHVHGGEDALLDTCDSVSGWRPYSGVPTPRVGTVEGVRDGATGKALQIHFYETAQAQFAGRSVEADASWDEAAGLSFWFKGDGSDDCVACSLIDGTYTMRYAALVSLKNTEWHLVTLRWEDFVPEILTADWFGLPEAKIKPSMIRALWFGRWFYFRPRRTSSFQIDDVRLAKRLPGPAAREAGSTGLSRTMAKLRSKQPVRVVSLGDSVTYGTHVPNREAKAYPGALQNLLRAKFDYEHIVVDNKGVGGLETRQGIVLLRRDLPVPPPDLVTVHFGYNDYTSMLDKRTAPERCRSIARENFRQIVLRIRALTDGKSDVLLIATVPGANEERRTAMEFFGEEARAVAAELKCGFTDAPRAAFREAWKRGGIEELFVKLDGGKLDVAHPNAVGQKCFADALLKVFPPEETNAGDTK